jgi:catechol 2,3-dioxygenase-like lactoylglutathione lyase family enzyme
MVKQRRTLPEVAGEIVSNTSICSCRIVVSSRSCWRRGRYALKSLFTFTLPIAIPDQKERIMELGAFSISLAVKDLEASRAFYEKFGFKVFAGDASQNWLILKNGDHVIGLFQGMFEKNILTFNPGWDSNAQKLETFTDVRDLQRQLKAQGVELQSEADESSTGPASFVAVDPDGNQILFDQHV